MSKDVEESVEEKLRRVYYGLDSERGGAFTGFAGFWKAAKQRVKGVSRKRAERFYRSLWLSQTLCPTHRPHLFRQIHANGLGLWLSMDGLYIGPRHGLNRFYYAYTGMDLASRRLDIFFTHALTAVQAVKAARQFLATFQARPDVRLFTDFGAEMVGTVFSNFCSQASIRHYYNNPSSENKTSILERAHRTIRGIAGRMIRAPKQVLQELFGKSSIDMVEALREAVVQYNHTYSRAVGMPPAEITPINYERVLMYRQRARAKQLDDYLTRELRRRGGSILTFPLPSEAQLPIGALVRVRLRGLVTDDDPQQPKKKKNTWAKEFASLKFSSQVYRIKSIRQTCPVGYTVESVEGSYTMPYSFTANELVLVNPPQRNGRGD